MVGHMVVVAIASPLFALGFAGSRADPAVRAPRIFVAIPASMVELVLVWAWHAPALHQAARHRPAVFALEQGTFLLAGFFLWASALGGGDDLRRARATGSVTALLLTAMHMTLLGALLALTPRVLYEHASPSMSLPPLLDQQLGGVIMLLGGGVAYLTGGLLLTASVLRSPDRSAL